MIYYGFDSQTKHCSFTSSGPTEPIPGIIVIESEESYDINAVCLGYEGDTPVILPRVPTSDELAAKAVAQRNDWLNIATQQIGILNDVVEFTTDPTAGYKLTAWREFRAKVYGVDPHSSTIDWPVMPEM